MGEQTGIQWCDHTFNPWWGCVKVSPACQHCYAETFSKRVGQKVWGLEAPRRFFGPKHWQEPLAWNAKAAKAGVRRRVFCASMADVFEDRPDVVQARLDLFLTIKETPSLDWLLLTKRPENIKRLLPRWYQGRPWPNLWLGTTVENQLYANERISTLLENDDVANTLFLSVEPLLSPVTFRWAAWDNHEPHPRRAQQLLSVFRDGRELAGHVDHLDGLRRLDWVIVGGESGAHARPMQPEWARAIRDECVEAGVAFFFKQWGGLHPKTNGALLDGREWKQFPASWSTTPARSHEERTTKS